MPATPPLGRRSAAASLGVRDSRRDSPTSSPRKPSGPNATRSSATTRCPTASQHPPDLPLAALADRDLDQAAP